MRLVPNTSPRCVAATLLASAALLALPGTAVSSPTLAAAGDIACPHAKPRTSSTCRQADTASVVTGLAPTAVAALGDNQYESGSLSEYQASFDPSWGHFKGLIHPAPGNHEYVTPGAAGYFQYFGPGAGDPAHGYYSYDLGSWHLIALNSNCDRISCPDELQWLRGDLATHPAPCTLAYWHHPLFTSGTTQGQANNLATRPFWQALYDASADVVLNGHDHLYERFGPQSPAGAADPAHGIREFIVGTGGYNFHGFASPAPNSEAHNNSTFGVLQLSLDATGYGWRFYPVPSGSYSDSGTGSCHGRAVASTPLPAFVPPATTGRSARPQRRRRPVVVRLSVRPQSLRSVLAHGLVARVSSNIRGRLTLAVQLDRVLARRLGLSSRGRPVVIATKTMALGRAGSVRVRLRLVRSVAKRFRKPRPPTLTVLATVRGESGDSGSTRRRISLKP